MKANTINALTGGFVMTLLSGCYHPPYNDYKPYNPVGGTVAGGAIAGTIIGAAVGTPITGAWVGGVIGAGNGLNRGTRGYLIKQIKKCGIQYVQYGDTMTMVVPTDQYFEFNSNKLNDINHRGLENMAKLLRYYSKNKIYVAGFTDNVGDSRHEDKLSQTQAETMLGFLWANGIKAERLDAAGYGSKFPIGDNDLVRGSAFNRRVEIQWTNGDLAQLERSPAMVK